MREENFWCKNPRYSEVRVIARRVIARYDCSRVVEMMTIRLGMRMMSDAFLSSRVVEMMTIRLGMRMMSDAFLSSRVVEMMTIRLGISCSPCLPK